MMNGHTDFFGSLKTDRDKTLALLFLNNLYANLFKTDQSLLLFLKKYEADSFARMILAQLPSSWESIADKTEVQRRILELKQKIQVLPTIAITIAIEPNEQILNSLEEWAARNFSGKIIFDITVRPQILGGAIIVRNGSYKDYSLTKRLKEILDARKSEFMAMLLK